MRRKIKGETPYFEWESYDVRTDIDKELLQSIGMVCLEWNFLEEMADFAFFNATELYEELCREVTSRVNGMDGKLEIINRAAIIAKALPQPVLSMIANTTAAIAQYKTYRDGVVHARLLSANAPTAFTHLKRGKPDEVLLTKDALSALVDHLIAAGEETIAMAHVLAYSFILDDPKEPWRNVFDAKRAEASQSFPRAIARYQERQTHRRSLPPLPRFPQSPPTQPETEAPQ